MNYNEMTTEELLVLREQKKAEIVRLNASQNALKVHLNSAYGALG